MLIQPTQKAVRLIKSNAAIKYKQVNHKAVIAKIVTRITEALAKPDFDSGTVAITIENPVEQSEL